MTRCFIAVFISFLAVTAVQGQQALKTPRIESILYVGPGKEQPLIVGLGGSEGGNAWASDRWKATRDQFLQRGYAFVALGYFGATGTPTQLDRIAIEDIHNAIITAANHPQIRKDRIAIVGGSRGADLALLVASYYPDITCVVGLVASHVVFPGHTQELTTSSWTYQGKELPFVPVNEEAVPFLMKRDLRGAFETMLKDSVAEKNALIKVANIKGPILLLSATGDEICPSTPMAEKMMRALDRAGFPYVHQHHAIEGSHSEPLKHFDAVYTFLDTYVKLKR